MSIDQEEYRLMMHSLGRDPLFAGFVFHDVTCNGARRDCQWARKIHLSRPAAPRKIAVLGADHNLIRPGGNPRPRVDAGSTAWLNDVSPGFRENF